MLASQAAIVFPALLLLEGENYYDEALSAADLQQHRGGGKPQLIGWEIVDSAGQRFLIRALVDFERIKAEPRTGWKRWLLGWAPQEPLYRFDLELEPLPRAAFSETHRRVMAKEAAQEAYHISEGGGPDEPADRERLERCRSIADIIALHNR
jgi:hypothetical protein